MDRFLKRSGFVVDALEDGELHARYLAHAFFDAAVAALLWFRRSKTRSRAAAAPRAAGEAPAPEGAGVDRVVGVHQHLGLDDRDEACLLADGRVAGERVRVRADAAARGNAVADRDHGSPLGEARAERDVLLAALRQAVEAERDDLAGVQRERLRAGVDLDPRDDALAASSCGNGMPSSALCRIVSSYRITPPTYSSKPGVVKSRFR